MDEEVFRQEFTPKKYYKIVRKMGFLKDEARTMTRFYNAKIYEPTIGMYQMRDKR